MTEKHTIRSTKTDYEDLILTTANELFQKHGIENVTMHQVAKVTNIGQATLYRRFANKGEICMGILSNDTEEFLNSLDEFIGNSGDTLSPLDQLEGVIWRIADYINSKAKTLVIIKNEYSRDLQLLQFNHPTFLYLHELISGLYSKALRAGEVVDIDVTITTQLLVAALSPDLFLYQQTTTEISKEAMIKGIQQLYIDGLRKKRRS